MCVHRSVSVRALWVSELYCVISKKIKGIDWRLSSTLIFIKMNGRHTDNSYEKSEVILLIGTKFNFNLIATDQP